jgi:dTDP-4-amino-4,6-dideoxygalactose transaminase
VQALAQADTGHVYHLFVVRVRHVLQPDRHVREELQAHLAARGIETLIHYPVPIPQQAALASALPADCPVASRACHEILSLPLHPAMHDDDVDAIAEAVNAFDS